MLDESIDQGGLSGGLNDLCWSPRGRKGLLPGAFLYFQHILSHSLARCFFFNFQNTFCTSCQVIFYIFKTHFAHFVTMPGAFLKFKNTFCTFCHTLLPGAFFYNFQNTFCTSCQVLFHIFIFILYILSHSLARCFFHIFNTFCDKIFVTHSCQVLF